MAALRILVSLLVGLCAYYFYTRETFSEEMVRGKRVLVTGSSMGIGEQIAYEFARMGAHVMVTARSEKRLQEVVQKCLSLGSASARYVLADMHNLTAAQKLAEEARSQLGGLDYLVLNHAGGDVRFGPFEGDMESVTSSMTVNFLSYAQLTVAAMDMLRESQGGIVVVSSLSGRIPSPFSVPYAATKFALEGFYSSLRAELHLRKIPVDVTVAVLGYINTDTALKVVGGKITMQASPKETCAQEIVKGGVMRRREVVYPYWPLKPILLLKDWVPELLEWLLRRSYLVENIL
ncbi:hydroxysteroid 11-beta-dehydrogenase 1-like protein A [Tiliqua scincoides]|uniref:hydroxysteroid 11-beta-dehydrogenase 1-like protein A n=1 Tax=Tiliqua scincoides TaxID=71010 RepID=UPI003462A9F3